MYLRTLATYVKESRSYSPAYLCCFKFERSYSPISCSDKSGSNYYLLNYILQEKFKDQYKYEVIGGLHSVTARQQLTSVNHTFANVKASVYAGLTDDEALHLAK